LIGNRIFLSVLWPILCGQLDFLYRLNAVLAPPREEASMHSLQSRISLVTIFSSLLALNGTSYLFAQAMQRKTVLCSPSSESDAARAIHADALLTMRPNPKIPSISESGFYRKAGKPDRIEFERIGNHGQAPIIAIYIAYRHERQIPDEATLYVEPHFGAGPIPYLSAQDVGIVYDGLTADPAGFGIPPGGHAELAVSAQNASETEVGAVLFADGLSEGSWADVKHVYWQRRDAYKAIVRAIPLLENIAHGKIGTSQALDTLNDRLSQLSKGYCGLHCEFSGGGAGPYDLPQYTASYAFYDDHHGGERIYRMLIDWLKTGGFADSQPTQDEPRIQELSQASGVSLRPAQAILLDKRLKEWQAELKGHLKPLEDK